jgi:hypothetical protein
MQIICSQTCRFVREDGETFTVSPSPKPQNAPDWIRDTLLFQWALKDHSIQEIVLVAASEPSAESSAAQEAEQQQATKRSKKAG